jgi:[histone H3]-lysine9 N-trimethyltransferase SUV39H
LDDKIDKGTRMYLVKWRNYGPEYNEWLRKSYLSCPQIINEYERKKKKKLLEQKQYKKQEEQEKMKSLRFGDWSLIKDATLPEPRIGRPYFTPDHQLPKPRRTFEPGTPQEEKWMELLKKSRCNYHIHNIVDDEGPPTDFEWIEESVIGKDVPEIDLKVTVGCKCDGDCWETDDKNACSCLATRGGISPYDKYGCIRFAPIAMAIYECNLKCACSIYCPNRVTQRIPEVDFCIYKTDNGRGWGIKTLNTLRKGQFISRVYSVY